MHVKYCNSPQRPRKTHFKAGPTRQQRAPPNKSRKSRGMQQHSLAPAPSLLS